MAGMSSTSSVILGQQVAMHSCFITVAVNIAEVNAMHPFTIVSACASHALT
jgi:hypothetical protein